MYRESSIVRFQYAVGVACVVVTLIYLAIYRPLSRHADQLDAPLHAAWKQLLEFNLKNRRPIGWDVATVSRHLREAEKNLRALQRAVQRMETRLEFAPEIREKLQQPFQFLDYESQRQQMVEDLRSLAVAHKVQMEPAVITGFPEYTYGKEKPALLWVQLALVNRLLSAAVASDPRVVRSLTLLPIRACASVDGKPPRFEEFPVRMVLNGPMESVYTFLLTVAGQPHPAKKPDGYPLIPAQPALFLERLMIKASADHPNEVSLEAVISGFLDHEEFP